MFHFIVKHNVYFIYMFDFVEIFDILDLSNYVCL